MSNVEFMNQLLAPYGPQLPLDQLVEQVNKLYHTAEARDYDEKHTEIREQLPSLWREMIRVAEDQCQHREYRILDFGCGTGFAAEQLLEVLPRECVSALACYDPCSAMLRCCRTKLAPRFPDAVFCDDLKQLPFTSSPFNLLATNSLLHHLPDPLRPYEQYSLNSLPAPYGSPDTSLRVDSIDELSALRRWRSSSGNADGGGFFSRKIT